MFKNNYVLQTTTTTHYTGALAEGAVEIETFPGLRGDGQGEITAIEIESLQNLDWQVELLDQSNAIKHATRLIAANATEYTISGVKKYYYSVTDLNIPIPFEAGYNTVLIGLRNMSSTAKTAGAAGAVKVTLVIQK